MIILYANSVIDGVKIPNTMHSALTADDKNIAIDALKTIDIPSYANGYKSFYYPADLSKALYDAGVDNTINAHSGRLVVNGDYVS